MTFNCCRKELGCGKAGSVLSCRLFTKVLFHSGMTNGFLAPLFQTGQQQDCLEARYSYCNGQSRGSGSSLRFAKECLQTFRSVSPGQAVQTAAFGCPGHVSVGFGLEPTGQHPINTRGVCLRANRHLQPRARSPWPLFLVPRAPTSFWIANTFFFFLANT